LFRTHASQREESEGEAKQGDRRRRSQEEQAGISKARPAKVRRRADLDAELRGRALAFDTRGMATGLEEKNNLPRKKRHDTRGLKGEENQGRQNHWP